MWLFIKIVVGFVLFVVIGGLAGYYFIERGNDRLVSGVSLGKEWPPKEVCFQVYQNLKDHAKLTDYDRRTFRNASCKVRKLTSSLPYPFASYEPYAVVFSNLVSARVTVNDRRIRIVGWSRTGIPDAWN